MTHTQISLGKARIKTNNMNNRNVFKNKSGQWVSQSQASDQPTSLHLTQYEAINAARNDLRNSGGGELIIHGEDGKIREKDTIAPGNDPRDIKG